MFDVMVNPELAVGAVAGFEDGKTVCATPNVTAATTSATRPAIANSLSLRNAFTDSSSSTQLLSCSVALVLSCSRAQLLSCSRSPGGRAHRETAGSAPCRLSLASPGGRPGHGGGSVARPSDRVAFRSASGGVNVDVRTQDPLAIVLRRAGVLHRHRHRPGGGALAGDARAKGRRLVTIADDGEPAGLTTGNRNALRVHVARAVRLDGRRDRVERLRAAA